MKRVTNKKYKNKKKCLNKSNGIRFRRLYDKGTMKSSKGNSQRKQNEIMFGCGERGFYIFSSFLQETKIKKTNKQNNAHF